MKIYIPFYGHVSVSMSHPNTRLESDCTEQGPKIFEHAIKVLAFHHTQTVDKRKMEIAAFVASLRYSVKNNVKPRTVLKWLYEEFDIPAAYDAVVSEMEVDVPSKTFAQIEKELNAFMMEAAKSIAANASSSKARKLLRADVDQWFHEAERNAHMTRACNH